MKILNKTLRISIGLIIMLWGAMFIVTSMVLFPNFMGMVEELRLSVIASNHTSGSFIVELIPLYVLLTCLFFGSYFMNKGFLRIMSQFEPLRGKIGIKREEPQRKV